MFFLNKENIVSICLGLHTQSLLDSPTTWPQAAPGSGFMWCLGKGECLQCLVSQHPGLSVPLKAGSTGRGLAWGRGSLSLPY